MIITNPAPRTTARLLLAAAALALAGCSGEGPAIEARPQAVSFAPAPAPVLDQASVLVSATASSGLPVRFTSVTPAICTVDGATGAVTGLATGTCTIAASQGGNSRYAPAPVSTQNITFSFSHTLTFAPLPLLGQYDRGTASASDSTGLPVSYATTTPATCSVTAATGLITALATGDCTVVAAAGSLQAVRTVTVTAPAAVTLPGAPTDVTASTGATPNSVAVHIGGTVSGGSPITGYTVASVPAGLTATGAASPVTVSCPTSCAGYRFTVTAATAAGTGAPSAAAEIVTGYDVITVFREPDTQPNDSIFTGSFTFNATTGVVTNLHGRLSESMTGGATPYPNDTMTWLTLANQLSSLDVPAQGGLLVTTFRLGTTNTLSPLFGGDGWSPGTGNGLQYGFPTAAQNPGNAYARIFVNTTDPTTPLSPAQIDLLAYADCAPGGMMGQACMTGTSVAGYGVLGTMGGFPVSQTVTRR